jgi:hypothetical protein
LLDLLLTHTLCHATPYVIYISKYVNITNQQKGLSLTGLFRVKLGHELATAVDHILAIDRVKDLLARFAPGHEIDLVEYVQVMGDCGLGHVERFHNITDAQLLVLQQNKDPLPCVVTQCLAKLNTIDSHYTLTYRHS